MVGVTGYSALLADEMILAGTFPTRVQVDHRRINPNNSSVDGDMYTPLHQARLQADTVVYLFEQRLDDPVFEPAAAGLREGIALGTFYGGYTRLWLGELFCWSILTGMVQETAPLMPDARVQQAITMLEEAETLAEAEGLEDYRLAAIVGQARGHLWLGNYGTAATLASEVPTSHVLWAEYSANDPAQYNKVYALTHGDTESVRWTVGLGTEGLRGNEEFPHWQEFVDLNLIDINPPGVSPFNTSIGNIGRQLIYSQPQADVLVASGVEARLIEAEVAVRNDETGAAETLLNDLRADYSFRATVTWGVQPPAAGNELEDLTLAGDLEADLRTVAAERARELWLTGDRAVTSRRLRWDPTVDIDLFPPKEQLAAGGDDIAFPIVLRELENNENLAVGDACPPGQSEGSWGHPPAGA